MFNKKLLLRFYFRIYFLLLNSGETQSFIFLMFYISNSRFKACIHGTDMNSSVLLLYFYGNYTMYTCLVSNVC